MTAHISKSFIRVLAFMLACLLLTNVSFVSEPSFAHAQSTIDELTEQKDDLALKQEELAAQRDETAASLEEQQEQSDIIREQIDAKSAEIAINEQLLSELDSKIGNTQSQIDAKEAEITALESEITSRYETLRTRLRAISKKSVLSSFLQYILGNSTYTDYLIGFKMTERISAHDQAMMDQLEADITAIEETKNKLKTDKAALEIERNQVDAVRADMEADKGSLQQLYNESDALAEEMAQDIEYLEQQIDETIEQQQALQNEIDNVIAQILAEEEEKRRQEEEARKEAEENGEEYIPSDDDLIFTGNGDGTMTWPTPTCTVITSSFKWREWSGTWHKGLDIACYGDAEGEPIVAAADGVVYVANDYDEWGMGYGYYMMIDHGYDSYGQRIITVYAHCSRIDIMEGDTVYAGQQIGLVGNTGNSYGAHLHFEVTVDGTAVDPVSNGYLSTDGIDVLA